MATQIWGDFASLINVNELTLKVRHAAQPTMAFSQAAGAPIGKSLGKNKGDTVQLEFFTNVDTAGGELSETEEVPSTGLTPIKTSYTIKEYGNGMSWTGKLEDLSRLEIEDNFLAALINDWKKLENSEAYTVAKTTDWKAAFIAAENEFVTNGTLVGTADKDLTLDNLRFLKTKAKKNLIPKYDGESYLYITGVDAINSLQSDPDYTELLRYDSGRATLNGELGRLAECRVIEDLHKIQQHAGGFDEGVLFGADGVLTDVACPIEIRREVKDVGRSVKVAYIFLGCWFKPLDQTDHAQEHLIHVSSA